MTPAWLGDVGITLLILALVVIAVEAVLMGIWLARVAANARAIRVMVQREQGAIKADLERLRLAVEETKRLWEPYGRVLRWLRHPLLIALIESYRRRMAVR